MFRREKGSIPVTSPPRAVKPGPSESRCSVHCATNQNRSSCCRSAKTCIARSFVTSTSAGDRAEISVIRVSSVCSASLDLRQILVHELHDHGTFADTGGNPLDGAVPDIAYDKNSRHIRFEQPRIAIQCPGPRPLPRVQQVRSGKNEAALVALDGFSQPFRPRLRSNEYEKAAGRELLFFTGGRALHGNSREPRFSLHLDHARPRPYFDVRRFLNLFNQVVRHRDGERDSAHQHHHLLRKLRKVHGGLAGGIRASDDVHGFAFAGQRFGGSTAVIHARALQVINPWNVQGPPLNPHSKEKRMTGNLRTIGKFQVPIGALNTNANGFLRREDLHAKAPRLRDSTTRQVKAGEPGRKAEIILNPRTKSGLASRRFALDDHRAQAFAGSIHGGSKPRRTSANDGKIVELG